MSISEENEELWNRLNEAKRKRAEEMPTEQDAINTIYRAYTRLKELGWNDAVFCPKDGSNFKVVEAGSLGIFDCIYHGEWPKGSWWLLDGHDVYPPRPILYKLTEEDEVKRKEKFAKAVGQMEKDKK